MSYYFVIVYDGENVLVETYESWQRHAALDRRFALEALYPSSEVVVLGGSSLEHIKMTHGRYFKGVEELAEA